MRETEVRVEQGFQQLRENLCRWTPSESQLTQDLRPGLTYFAPPGLVSGRVKSQELATIQDALLLWLKAS